MEKQPKRQKQEELQESCTIEKLPLYKTINSTKAPIYYHIDHEIGSGAYSTVYKGSKVLQVSDISIESVAIKDVTQMFNSSTSMKRLLREVTALKVLNKHPNIVELKDVHRVSNQLEYCIIMEEMDTNLHSLIHSQQYLSLDHVRFFLFQLLNATNYMHQSGIVHRDLGPKNILINEDCTLKIADFGLCRYLSPTVEEKEDIKENSIMYTNHIVTRQYRPPEVILQSKKQTFAIDMWSVGCIFFELLQMLYESKVPCAERKVLFPGSTCFPFSVCACQDCLNFDPCYRKKDAPQSVRDKHINTVNQDTDQLNVIFSILGTPPAKDLSWIDDEASLTYIQKLPTKLPNVVWKSKLTSFAGKEAVDLLDKLLTLNPHKRITAFEALKHPYLQEVTRDKTDYEVNRNTRKLFEGIESIEDKKKLLSYLYNHLS